MILPWPMYCMTPSSPWESGCRQTPRTIGPLVAGKRKLFNSEEHEMVRALVFGLACLVAAPALAGKYNAVLNIGDAAPSWTGLEGVDGKKHALVDLADKDVVVVVFISNSCDV